MVFFYIKRFSDVHSCGTDVQTSKNSRVSSDLVSSIISEIMRDKLLTKPCEVVTILKRDYGLDVSYHVVWLGVEKEKVVIHGDHSLSFDQLRWYSDAVMRYNSESYINIDYVANGTFLKGKYKGRLLKVTVKDENNGLFPVAFAIVNSETTTNWSCYCLQHLKNNLRDRMKGIDNGFRDHLVSSLGDCAYELTMVGFHEKLEKLKEEGKQRARSFFKELAPEHWANSYFRGMRYGEMTSNAAESFNNWIKEVHNLPITQMMDTIRT
ncbi:uncharacterized protein LOC114318473 [Camellia sinensis]|uniref:uncharacterized protein LOC114318473 n=1 Tax=Camellia sinensis TaxID=4442 RepID=UPI001036CA61|nr:uncharacterized protein LOC114318473 [Camellia sinensis]